VARKKSDAGDALVLAHILRTDRAAHRPLPADSELVQAIAVLARAQQDAVWERTYAHNNCARCYASTTRRSWPHSSPSAAGSCVRKPARSWPPHPPPPPPRRSGRHRGIDTEAARLQAVLRAEYLHHPRLVEDAFGMQALALLRQLNVACANADELAAAAVAHFDQHPDSEIITSLPGLGSLTGARVLAEIGDDRSRFADARSLKAYAGAAPVTRASGKSLTVTHRRVKNQRLAAVGYVWAFAALTASPGARAHYDRRRNAGDRHTAAQRNLFNRLLGCLHHCLDTHQTYNENIAFPPPRTEAQEPAA
jgi:transposase